MSAIITTVFKATFGLLVNKARDKAAEKLKEGDVTDKRIRDLIQREINDIKSKLDGLARKELLAAIDAFEVGVRYLYQAMDADVDAAMAGTREKGDEASSTPTVNTVALATEMGRMELTELNEKTKRALSQAKERFKMAREEATRAFNNEALSTLDRIKAIRYRVMATMLQSAVETVGIAGDLSSLSAKSALENALPECEQCLQKLNSLPDVQNNFKVELEKGPLKVKGRFGKDERREIISAVCQVNRAIYDTTEVAGKYGVLLNLPSVDTEEDKIDPLRDDRVAKVLRKVGMEHCCVAWSFGQEGEEEHKLKIPRGIAINADGQFIIAGNLDKIVKVYGSSGKFVLQFHPERIDTETNLYVRDVATDMNSNIFVLVELGEELGAVWEVQVFSHTADLLRKFPVREWGLRLAVTNNKVLVLTAIPREQPVHVYEHDGTYVRSFGGEILKHACDITAGPDGQVMILDLDDSCVLFTEDGEQQGKFNINPKEDQYHRIACHPSGEFVVVPGWERGTKHLCVAIYTKDGEYVRRIIQNERVENFGGITVSMEGHIAVAVQDDSGDGKVIVL